MSNFGVVREDKRNGYWYTEIPSKYVNTKKRERFYRLPIINGQFVTCKTESMAETLRQILNREYDIHKIIHVQRFRARRPHHIKKYASEWLKKQTHLGDATWRDYETYIRKYIVPIHGDVYIEDVTEGLLESFVKTLPLPNPKSKQNVLGCYMKILHDAEREGTIARAPFKPRMRGKDKVVDPEVIWVEHEDQQKVLNALDENYRGIVEFQMRSGCRPSEARALRWSDIKWDRGEIVFSWNLLFNGKIDRVKGKKPLPIPITERSEEYDPPHATIREILDAQPKTSEFVFVNKRTGKPFNKNLEKVVNRATKKVFGYSIGMSKLGRTSFAQHMVNSGENPEMVGRWLRHAPGSGRRITKRYYEFQTGSMKSAVDKVRKIR